MRQWKSRPIFVSSTFRDMHAERDCLHRIVFPALEERLRQRYHHLEPIDLRWGIDTTSSDAGEDREYLVLKVCLEEIDRSRPFLVALLGDRYGWVPSPGRLKHASSEAGYNHESHGCSVTALEIEYGILNRPAQRARSFFYMRAPLPYAQMTAETAARYSDAYSPDPRIRENHAKLVNLKERIQREYADHVRMYSAGWDDDRHRVVDLESFAQMAIDDLWGALDLEIGVAAGDLSRTWQEAERHELEVFLEARSKGFVGRAKEIAGIHEFVGQTDGANGRILCVSGESGSGKSSLWAQIHRELTQENLLLLAHAAGVTAKSSRLDVMLRRWIEELEKHFKEDPSVTETDSIEALVRRLQTLCRRAARTGTKVICLTDALNQFERTKTCEHMGWLPESLPAGMCWIMTAVPGTETRALSQRDDCEIMQIAALASSEAAEIVRRISARHHKRLDPDVVHALLSRKTKEGKTASESPLWLELALEELLLLDEDDFARVEKEYKGSPEHMLHALLMDTANGIPGDIEELYGAVFRRLEDSYGARDVQAFCVLTELGRYGFREKDLEILMPRVSDFFGERRAWLPLQFAALRRGFRSQLSQGGAHGEWDFSHQLTRAAVRRHYPLSERGRRALNGHVAEHLQNLPADDPLHVSETMVHWIASRNERGASQYWAAVDGEEKDGCANAIADYILTSGGSQEALDWVMSVPSSIAHDDSRHSKALKMLFELSNGIDGLIDTKLPENGYSAYLRGLLELVEFYVERSDDNISWLAVYCPLLRNLAWLENTQGNAASAKKWIQKALEIDRATMKREPASKEWTLSLANSLRRQADIDSDRGSAPAALEAYESSCSLFRQLAETDPGDKNRRADLSRALERLSTMDSAAGDCVSAKRRLEEALSIYRSLAQDEPESAEWGCGLADIQFSIACVNLQLGQLESSKVHLAEAIELTEKMALRDPDDFEIISDLVARLTVLTRLSLEHGSTDDACEVCERCLSLAEDLVAKDPGSMTHKEQLCRILSEKARIENEYGRMESARTIYKRLLNIRRQCSAKDPNNTNRSYLIASELMSLADVEMQVENPAAARVHLAEAIEIVSKLYAMEPESYMWKMERFTLHNRLGRVSYEEEDFDDALSSFEQALAMGEELAQSDPGNVIVKREVSESLLMLGEVFFVKEDADAAVGYFRRSLDGRKEVAASDPENTDAARNVATAMYRVAYAVLEQGNIAEARSVLEEARAIVQELAEKQPQKILWRRDICYCLCRLADLDRQEGRFDEEKVKHDEALDIYLSLALAEPESVRLLVDYLEERYDDLCDDLDSGRYRNLCDQYLAMLRACDRVLEQDNTCAPLVDLKKDLHFSISWCCLFLDVKDAFAHARASMAMGNDAVAQVDAEINLAHAFLLSGQLEEARERYSRHLNERDCNGNEVSNVILSDLDTLLEQGAIGADKQVCETIKQWIDSKLGNSAG